MGRWLGGNTMLSFLWMGATNCFLKCLGIIPVDKDSSQINLIGRLKFFLQDLRTRAGISLSGAADELLIQSIAFSMSSRL